MSGYCKRFQDIRQLFNLASVISPLNFIQQLELKKFLRMARQAGNKKTKNKKIIPTSSVFKSTIKELDRSDRGKLALLLILMAGSGRRAIDIIRLNSSRVFSIGQYKYKVLVPYDKTNSEEISYKIDLNALPPSYLPTNLHTIDQAFRAELDRELFPFENCSNTNLSRKLKFHPHAIRSLVAIHLTSLGLEDGSIMAIAGWKDMRSLQLYRRLGRFEFGQLELCELVRKANK